MRARTRRRLPAVATILLGTVAGQGTVIAISPLLTRMYSASDFGALAVVTGICSIIGAFATFGVDRAVIVAPTSLAVRQLSAIGLVAALVIAGAVWLCAWTAKTQLAEAFRAPSLESLWWLFPCTTLAISVQRIVSARIARERRYGVLARRNTAQGLAQSTWNLAMAPLGPIGLIGGLAIGRLAGLLGLWNRGARQHVADELTPLRTTLASHRRFFLVSPWSSLLNVVGQQAPAILLALSLGSTAAGYVALTMRVLGTPVGMIADAVAQWSAGAFGSRVRSDARVGDLCRSVVFRLAFGAIGAAALVVLAAPAVFEVVFGADWVVAGGYAQALAPAFALQVVASPVTQLLSLLGRQGTQLLWDALRLLLTGGAVLVTSALGADTIVVVAALSASMIVAYSLVLVLVWRAVRHHDTTTGASAC